jgi:endonuclease/exonuclease/phosphatase family metal-dependent hydrolase
VKLVTWNTQWCCGNDGIVSPQRIVEGARALCDFDVLCLQEIAANYPRLRGDAGGDQPVQLAQLLPGFEVFFAPAVDEWEGGERRRFGNLIATRLPVAQVHHQLLPWPADGGVRSMPRVCAMVTVVDPALGAVRIMTTHLEFYSKTQRMAQAVAVRDLHAQACAHAIAPPAHFTDGSPFQSKPHTPNAIVCGDFNFASHDPEYAALTQPFGHDRLHDAWRVLNGEAPQPATFHVHDRTYSPDPVACDFVFVSDTLQSRVKGIVIDPVTQVSDHQPVAIELS